MESDVFFFEVVFLILEDAGETRGEIGEESERLLSKVSEDEDDPAEEGEPFEEYDAPEARLSIATDKR